MKTQLILLSVFTIIANTFLAITGTTTIMSDGISRTYVYYAPGASVNPNLPVMIVMHGDGGNATAIRNSSNFDAVADAQNFLVIYPNAINGNWNRSADNLVGDACTNSANDVKDVLFVSDLIDHLCSTYQINKSKVYASGHSAGGFMTYNLAVQLSNKIAAFAPVAGLLCGDNSFLTTAFAANAAVPIYHIHGDADNIVGYPDANNTPTSYGEWPLAAFGVESCGSDTYTSTVNVMPGVIKHVFCSGPKEVSLIQIVGGGHNWPSVAGYDAATAIYNFCEMYSLSLSSNCGSSAGVEINVLENQILLYPNPTSEKLTLDFGLMQFSDNVTAQIFDCSGKRVSNLEFISAAQTLDVSDLQNGMYTVVINTVQGSVNKRFSILR